MDVDKESVEKVTTPPYVAVLDTQLIGSEEEARMNFEAQRTQHPSAYVLLVDASGGSKDILNSFITEEVEKGNPVFLLSKNYGKTSGIQQVSYGTQSEAVNAGATPLRDVNIHGTVEVVGAVQNAVRQGITGDQLKTVVVEKFGSPVPRSSK